MFANKYLENNNTVFIPENPNPSLGISIIIPCFREPDILQTLHSLYQCKLPDANVEVIILINHSETSPEEVKVQNMQTVGETDYWIDKHQHPRIKYFAVGPVELKKKWAGAGLARKKGMDEAIRRFNLLNKPEGIIVSLDADTLVNENYLIEIEKYFKTHPDHAGATIKVQHQLAGLEKKHLQGIRLYEKYMTYYKNALAFTGYPYPMFTVGSAFAVTAIAYVKRGGMNRRQAGEDFYFLQNLAQTGTVGEINSTVVFPSARLSNRVPFGTGPALQKWMSGEEDLNKTYNFQAFANLKTFFLSKDALYKSTPEQYQSLLSELPKPVTAFLEHDNLWMEIKDLNNNCSTLSSFQKRFYQKFNAFKILKYLNFVHTDFFKKADLNQQELLLDRYHKLERF